MPELVRTLAKELSPMKACRTPTFRKCVWLFSMYGGMKLSGDPQTPHDECSLIGGVTATREGLAKFLRLLDPELQPAAQFRTGG
jgi:hypothetical protein